MRIKKAKSDLTVDEKKAREVDGEAPERRGQEFAFTLN